MTKCPMPDDMTKPERQARAEAIDRLETFVKSDLGGFMDIGIRDPAKIPDGDDLECAWCEHECIFLLSLDETVMCGSCACPDCLDKLRGSVIPLGRI